MQLTLAEQENFEQFRRKTRREVFQEQMDKVVPWRELEGLIEPYYPKAGSGRPPPGLSFKVRIYPFQHWFSLSDPGAEEAVYDSPALRGFARDDLGRAPATDETTILNFRHLLERHDLCGAILDRVNHFLESRDIRIGRGTIVDATIIHAPSRQRTPVENVIRKCTRRVKATSGISARRRTWESIPRKASCARFVRRRPRWPTRICSRTFCT
jgi:transposase, IS5 family